MEKVIIEKQQYSNEFKEVYTILLYHENGNLWYKEKVAIIYPIFTPNYDRAMVNKDGEWWIRIGENAKYYDNGQLAWVLDYNMKGEVIKTEKNSYRKDGTIIEY